MSRRPDASGRTNNWIMAQQLYSLEIEMYPEEEDSAIAPSRSASLTWNAEPQTNIPDSSRKRLRRLSIPQTPASAQIRLPPTFPGHQLTRSFSHGPLSNPPLNTMTRPPPLPSPEPQLLSASRAMNNSRYSLSSNTTLASDQSPPRSRTRSFNITGSTISLRGLIGRKSAPAKVADVATTPSSPVEPAEDTPFLFPPFPTEILPETMVEPTTPRRTMSFPSLQIQRKKRKLVISGIKPGQDGKLENLKKWCQSFGDVRNFRKQPNGDIHVEFVSPDVADMVCRISATVVIHDVGSVRVSWYVGKK